MKVLVVTPYYHPKIGGLENYARQLGIALHDIKQWEIVIATSSNEGSATKMETVDGMKVYRLRTWFKLSNTPINLLWPFHIRKIIRSEKPDLILAHTPVPSMADAAALASGHTPFVLVYHASTLLKGDAFLFNLIARAYSLYERITLTRADRIIAVSDYVKTQLCKSLQAKTFVVPNAIWNDQIVQRKQPVATDFLFIGSLDRTHSWKGLDLIIKSMEGFRRLHGDAFILTVMGGGNDRPRYESLVQELALTQNVIFLGAKTGEEKDDAIRKATALITYPTTANDAFPTVMLEAWAKGVPVVAAAIGPIPSLITDQQDGYLVAPHQPALLAETLQRIVADPVQRAKVADTALRRTRTAYTWERQADTVAAIAEDIL
jgi:glycosyltransferase involved in cell wall biosynthesis